MQVTYTAEDGTIFDSSDKCLAYEERDGEQFEAWRQKLIDENDNSGDSLFNFIVKIELGRIQLKKFEEFWVYRRKLIELAKSFEDVS